MKDQNSLTLKNKSEKQKEKPLNIYKESKRNFNSGLSDKKNNKKTLATSSTSYPQKNKSYISSNIKPLNSYKETLTRAYNKLQTVLHSYNMFNEAINKKITNDIIFDEKKRIVSVFKDYLLWDETSDFFKQYYKKNKSIKMILKFITYYEEYTKFYPEYGPNEELLKILKKHIKKKRKLFKKIEQNEAKKYIIEDKNINDDNKKQKFERLIKDSEIQLSKSNSNYLFRKNSKSTLILDSIDKDNQSKNKSKKGQTKNKEFYFILKEFIDNDDKLNYNKEESNLNNLNNIFIFNSKLSKYFKKSFNEVKNKEIKKKHDRHITISTYSKQKKINMNILNNIIAKRIKPISKDEKIKHLIDKGKKKSKENSLNKKCNNNILMSSINKSTKLNNKINGSNSISKNKKLDSIKYNEQTSLSKIKPQNIKKLFNIHNKNERYEKNNSIGNYYCLFPYINNTEGNEKLKQSPKSVLNNSPHHSKKKNNLFINTDKIKNNHIFDFEKLKKINSINQINYTERKHIICKTKTFSEAYTNSHDIYYNTNSNNEHLKLKSEQIPLCQENKNSEQIKNIITKISPIKKNQKKNKKSIQKKQNKPIIRKKTENPFRVEISSTINNSTNQNILSNITKKSKLKITNIISITNNNNKEEKKNDKTKKSKNNLILINTNLNQNLSGKKKSWSKKINIKNSFSSNHNNKNNQSHEKNKKENNLIKNNNILKNTIEKSTSKKGFIKSMKTSNNSILKSCCSFGSNLAKQNILNNKDSIQANTYKKNTNKEMNLLNFDENSFLKNTIKNKYEIHNNNNKKTRICLRLPITNNKNKI